MIWHLGLCQWKHNEVWVLSLKIFWILLTGMILPIHCLLLMFLLCENFMPISWCYASAYCITIPHIFLRLCNLLTLTLSFRVHLCRGSFHRFFFGMHPLSFPGKKGENISKFLGILDMTLLIVTSSPYLLFYWWNVFFFSLCSAYRFAILLLDWTW